MESAVTGPDTGAAAVNGIYVSGEDQLRTTVFNALAGVIVTVRGRILTCDNAIVPFQDVFTPTSNRAASTLTSRLTTGWLLNVNVVVSTGAPLTDQTFARVSIIRGEGTAALELGTLASCSITAAQPLAWPGSPVRNSLDGAGAVRAIAGTTPAAGAEISETVPTGARWELISFAAQFVTSGAAANRLPILTLDDGANVFFRDAFGGAETAGTTYQNNWFQGGPPTPALLSNTQSGELPINNRLPAGARIRTVTGSIQGADQWSAVEYLVREWPEAA